MLPLSLCALYITFPNRKLHFSHIVFLLFFPLTCTHLVSKPATVVKLETLAHNIKLTTSRPLLLLFYHFVSFLSLQIESHLVFVCVYFLFFSKYFSPSTGLGFARDVVKHLPK